MIDRLINSHDVPCVRGDYKPHNRTQHIRYTRGRFYAPADPTGTMVTATLHLADRGSIFHTDVSIRYERSATAVRVLAYLTEELTLPANERVAAALGRYQYITLPEILLRCERALGQEQALERWELTSESVKSPTLLASRFLTPPYAVHDVAERLGRELAPLTIRMGDYEYRTHVA